MDNKSYISASIAMAVLIQSTAASAQSCSHVAGNWTDNYAYQWNLNQNTTGQVTGSVYIPPPCDNTWSVSGDKLVGNGFSISASNPDPVAPCVNFFEYVGLLQAPGCHTGSGTWIRMGSTFGSFVWDKPCDIPSHETTVPNTWGAFPYRTAHWFDVTLFGGTGPNFGGRTISEHTFAPGEDDCHFPESEFDPFTTIATEGLSITLSNTNTFNDLIGRREDIVDYYRDEGRAPCDATIYQEMRISCAFGTGGYQVNTLIITVGTSTVSNSRDGVIATRAWP